MYDIEEKRRTFLKLQRKKESEGKKVQKNVFRSSKLIEKEKADSKWTTSKVRFIDFTFS